jgi:hypothetical protein
MKILLAAVAVLALAWLGLWVSNTGVLVSSAGTKIPMTRECKYFIGVTVVTRIVPLADRCPLARTVGP